MIEDLFKENNLKITHQRELIFNIVYNSLEPTVKDILDYVGPMVDKSTVYRILDLFTEKRIFIKNVNIEGIIYYTINNHEHNHYIDCVKCHKKTKIDHCPIELDSNIEGYTVLTHSIQLEGICDECKKEEYK